MKNTLGNIVLKPNHTLAIFLALFLLSSCSGFRSFDHKKSIDIILGQPEQVVYGKQNWKGPQDCSSHAYLNKTPTGFLFTIEVYDDSIKTGDSHSFMNDGIELYFDFRPPRLREKNKYEKGVFQAVILPEPGKKQIAPIEWFPKYYDTSVPGTRAYTELKDSGYVLQISIPYSGLKRHHFWPRKSFYMDVAINDADTGVRESQLMWKGKIDNWKKPDNFYKVQFNESELKNKKTNILLILTDQQTIKAMGAYGNPYVKTPNMDALAKHGIRFTKSYCTSPVRSASRASILSGKMPSETGIIYEGQTIDSSFKNMGEYFTQARYYTNWVGKWGLTDYSPQNPDNVIKGFKLLNISDKEQFPDESNLTDEPITSTVQKFLKTRKREPFLLVVSFQNPQDISSFSGNQDNFIQALNIHSTPPLPDNFSIINNEPEFIKDARIKTSYEDKIIHTKEFTEKDWRNYLYQYYNLIEKLDTQIGLIIETLEKEGMDESTLIIFTSDHGEGAASHKWATNLSLYEENIKVPLIISHFGKKFENQVNNIHLASGADILPTMMDYAEIDIPEEITGLSLKTIIENPDTSVRKYAITELFIDPSDTKKTAKMISNGEFKYIQYSYGKNSEQFFNLNRDPGETKNLIHLYKHSKIYKELKTELAKAYDSINNNQSINQ